MQKLLLVSILAATFAVPAMLRRAPSAQVHGALLRLFGLCVGVYVLFLRFVYPHLF